MVHQINYKDALETLVTTGRPQHPENKILLLAQALLYVIKQLEWVQLKQSQTSSEQTPPL